jgi:transcriptional regulator with XRE-family HTH domain
MIERTPRKYYRDEELLIKIGNNIKKYREESGISLKILLVKTGIGYSHLVRIELGKVDFRISRLFKLAEGLGIEPKKLLP